MRWKNIVEVLAAISCIKKLAGIILALVSCISKDTRGVSWEQNIWEVIFLAALIEILLIFCLSI